MMESYGQHGATPIFYVVYLIVTLYFASNVVSNEIDVAGLLL